MTTLSDVGRADSAKHHADSRVKTIWGRTFETPVTPATLELKGGTLGSQSSGIPSNFLSPRRAVESRLFGPSCLPHSLCRMQYDWNSLTDLSCVLRTTAQLKRSGRMDKVTPQTSQQTGRREPEDISIGVREHARDEPHSMKCTSQVQWVQDWTWRERAALKKKEPNT